MYKITFNSFEVATLEKEQDSIGLALNLHNISTVTHNIVVTKDGKDIFIFNQFKDEK